MLALKQSEPESREVYWAGTGLATSSDAAAGLIRFSQATGLRNHPPKADPGNADWQRVSKKNGETATALVGQSWCPKGLDALSYASGYIEGEAQRAKRPLRAISSPKARKDAP